MTTPHTDAAAIMQAALEAQSLATALARSHLAKFRSLIAGRYNQAAVNHNKPELATAYKELLHALDQIEAEPADLPRAAKTQEQTYAVPVSKFPPMPIRERHNPDDIGPEIVGEGYRLFDIDEVRDVLRAPLLQEIEGWGIDHHWTEGYFGTSPTITYRTRLTRSELRKARGFPPEK